MKYILCLLLAVAFALPVLADDVKKVDPPVVILPDLPPLPPQPPAPKMPVKLAADQIFLIRASVECTVVEGVEGLVTVTTMSGPVVIRSRFTDSNGIETRTLADKYLYLVTAAGTGKTDIIIIPAGGKAIRRCLDVDNGTPTPPIPPDPPIPTDPFTKALQAAYSTDPDTAKPANIVKLAALYRVASEPATLNDPSLVTFADLLAQMKKASGKVLPATGIMSVRRVIEAELNAMFPTDPTKPIDRALAAKELAKIATALETIKP